MPSAQHMAEHIRVRDPTLDYEVAVASRAKVCPKRGNDVPRSRKKRSREGFRLARRRSRLFAVGAAGEGPSVGRIRCIATKAEAFTWVAAVTTNGRVAKDSKTHGEREVLCC